MSVVTLEEAKADLDVIHSADDSKLQLLLDAAENEAAQFLDLDELADLTEASSDSSEEAMPSSVKLAVLMLLRGSYQAGPEDQQKYRAVAEVLLSPFRSYGA